MPEKSHNAVSQCWTNRSLTVGEGAEIVKLGQMWETFGFFTTPRLRGIHVYEIMYIPFLENIKKGMQSNFATDTPRNQVN